ncbi:ATP-binding cassette domain-containing protein [Bacillus cereus]|uniref:ATP-binding cassette domain-containing protein n=1 Tax=Bacillus cereus TaxID=1396 RepID=UPI0009922AC4|nr:ABC transporter ATP-binding protein [Bacillus cereus]OOQ91893.1 hypothetical protein BW898_26805 [Bacillus cereus]
MNCNYLEVFAPEPDKTILHNLDITFEKGTIYGITGHNGSGKTMLLRLISGMILPTTGKIEFNTDLEIGIIIETPNFIPEISAFKNLKLLAIIKNKITDEQIKQTLTDVGLAPDNPLPVKKYSLGMRQRLAIAQAIMEDQKILLLDEPLNAIDAKGIDQIGNLLLKKKQAGATILLATHRSEEINKFCDIVLEISDGKLSSKNTL